MLDGGERGPGIMRRDKQKKLLFRAGDDDAGLIIDQFVGRASYMNI